MPQFKCDACGHVYDDQHNFAGCPVCLGLGKPDEKCTCVKWRTAFAGKYLNAFQKKDLKCPIHGKTVRKKAS